MHKRLPVTLVLCLRAAPALFLARLARPTVRALRGACFPLPSPAARLAAALAGGILGRGGAGFPFPGPALLAWTGRRFVRQDASVAGFLRALQVGNRGFGKGPNSSCKVISSMLGIYG